MLIGLSGKAGVGKDTSADYLVKRFGFVKVALADPLKRICRDVFDFTDEQLWGPSEMRNKVDERYLRGKHLDQDTYVNQYLTPRYALQQLGTEWGRDCYNNVWIDYALHIADKLLHKSGILRSLFFNYDQKNGLYTSNTPVGPKPKGVAIPDCRFINEFEAIKKVGGKVWRIYRPEAGLKGAAATHRSESEQEQVPDSYFDTIIKNYSTLEDLYDHLEYLMKGQ